MAITAKIDAVTFTGRSGRGYPFRIYLWDTKFKAVPGVYVVASRSIEPGAAPRYDAVFVGMSPDLSKALKAHSRSDCFQMYYANVVGLLLENDAEERSAITEDLVAALEPPCNAPDAE